MQGAGGKALGFGKSRAKLLTEAHGRVTFEDVAGVDEAKLDLQEIVEFLRDPAKFQRLGGRIPRGVLLVGPPGTGKTLLARAIAGEANVPFFTISGSDFVEMFVGVGASRVRDMFEQAKKNAPCIIFIDEIDAVGRHRGAGLGGGNDEREQTLNQLLVEMDGFEANEGIILIAATNRPDVLDPALLRPGRFDRQVVVPNPDVVGREQILKVHVRKVPLAPDVNLKTIARGTPGFSGADLMNLVNEAALMAARRNKRMVTQVEFEDAKDKVMMGAERKSLVMTEEEKLLTAYHEGGHAIVALNVKATDPVHKATIIPRGRALGMVMQLPERDKLSMSLEQMTSRLAIMMGGRVAEELVFGRERVTSGAASDIEQATKLARMMVTRWGLSDALGTVAYGENQEEVFLGYSVARQQNISEETSRKIDAEIRRLVEAGYNEAQAILTEKRADLETLAKGLLEFETLTGDEIKDLLLGKRPARESVIEPATPRSSTVPTAGAGRNRPRPETGPMEPQPQA
jgi:cell division protease FtsH